MIIVVSRPFYSRLYISNLKLCQEDKFDKWTGVAGRGSLVACRVSRVPIHDFQPTPATYIRDLRPSVAGQDGYSDIAVLGHFCAGHKLVAPVAIESLYQLAFVIHSHHSLHNLSCCFCCFYCCLQVIQMWSPCWKITT